MASRMIPGLWLRFIVLLGFAAFMIYEKLPWLAVFAGVFSVITLIQLYYAYRERRNSEKNIPAEWWILLTYCHIATRRYISKQLRPVEYKTVCVCLLRKLTNNALSKCPIMYIMSF
ncbi:hypothetical protein CPFRC_05110 [Corynebacterium pseudotuberculosis FRC41]|nr:hypothetical protein AK970_04810 [Corynebacterium pseudotuberculosis]QGW57332.1 hypothetical protein CPFRC_05110 [Corynebacterium pseudotuberculosis FRC41]